MRDVSVLDPTCGSGAFLFAALNILEPLYTACLEGMQGFLGDLARTERPHHPEALRDFRDVLEQVEKHPSERYFILKSIVLNNLYGVDIMEEAVEICKLRLFLKLVAQLESYKPDRAAAGTSTSTSAPATRWSGSPPWDARASGDGRSRPMDNIGRCFPRNRQSLTASKSGRRKQAAPPSSSDGSRPCLARR